MDHAGRVLSRRNKRALNAPEFMLRRGTLRRVGQRQGLQLALMERRVG